MLHERKDKASRKRIGSWKEKGKEKEKEQEEEKETQNETGE